PLDRRCGSAAPRREIPFPSALAAPNPPYVWRHPFPVGADEIFRAPALSSVAAFRRRAKRGESSTRVQDRRMAQAVDAWLLREKENGRSLTESSTRAPSAQRRAPVLQSGSFGSVSRNSFKYPCHTAG